MGIFNALMGNAASVSVEELTEKYGNLLATNEKIDAGYKLIRDVFLFTNKRLILIDVQGMTGKKIEYMSVLYKAISRFSIESAGHLDLDAELKIWISSENSPSISKKFSKQANIYEVQKTLTDHLV